MLCFGKLQAVSSFSSLILWSLSSKYRSPWKDEYLNSFKILLSVLAQGSTHVVYFDVQSFVKIPHQRFSRKLGRGSVWHSCFKDIQYFENIVGIMACLAMGTVQWWNSRKIWATILVLTHSFSNLEKNRQAMWGTKFTVANKVTQCNKGKIKLKNFRRNLTRLRKKFVSWDAKWN